MGGGLNFSFFSPPAKLKMGKGFENLLGEILVINLPLSNFIYPKTTREKFEGKKISGNFLGGPKKTLTFS